MRESGPVPSKREKVSILHGGKPLYGRQTRELPPCTCVLVHYTIDTLYEQELLHVIILWAPMDAKAHVSITAPGSPHSQHGKTPSRQKGTKVWGIYSELLFRMGTNRQAVKMQDRFDTHSPSPPL